MAKTLEGEIDFFERFDRILASSEAPRNNSLRKIDRHRAALGGAVRHAFDEVQDAEFHASAASRRGRVSPGGARLVEAGGVLPAPRRRYLACTRRRRIERTPTKKVGSIGCTKAGPKFTRERVPCHCPTSLRVPRATPRAPENRVAACQRPRSCRRCGPLSPP
jgi:hypothetical protein